MNDTHGHLVGDRGLKDTGEAAHQAIHEGDASCALGATSSL